MASQRQMCNYSELSLHANVCVDCGTCASLEMPIIYPLGHNYVGQMRLCPRCTSNISDAAPRAALAWGRTTPFFGFSVLVLDCCQKFFGGHPHHHHRHFTTGRARDIFWMSKRGSFARYTRKTELKLDKAWIPVKTL